MAKIYGQLEKAQLENTTSDTASHPKGMITYRTDLNQAKISNGTAYKLLIDEDSTQSLSNKTYANPSITGAITSAQTTTPANPASGSNKLYFKADGKLYTLDSAGNEAMVGSGTGGVKNLITNGNADDTSSSIFVPYADAASTRPVDGTGGSPTVTTSMTTSTPLDGAKSFLLTKPAANVQGQGWAVPFTVDPAYRAKSLKISVDYIVNSGTFVAGGSSTESDVIWYIYDVTNSQLIEPSNIKMFSNNSSISDKFEATFQSSATGSSYRLIAHVQSVSALAYELKVDNIIVSPQTYVFGTPVTDSKTITPALTNLGFTAGVNVLEYWRVGDKLFGRGFFSYSSGTGSASNLFLTLPEGLVIDTTKLGSTINSLNHAGQWSWYDDAGSSGTLDDNFGPIAYDSTTTIGFRIPNTSNRFLTNVMTTNDTFSYSFSVPIVGWSSSTQMSDSASTRVVAFDASSPTSTHNSSTAKVTGWVKNVDTHGAFDSVNNRYIAPVSGNYRISASMAINNTVLQTSVFIYKNGVAFRKTSAYSNGGVNASPVCDVILALNAGDYVEVFFQTSSATLTGIDTTICGWSIERITGPSAIAASELVSCKYATSAGQAISNGADIGIAYGTAVFDSHGSYNTSTGIFTAPVTGKYRVTAYVRYASASFTASTDLALKVYKNGSLDFTLDAQRILSTATIFPSQLGGSDLVDLKAGETIQIRTSHGEATSRSLNAASGNNFLSIERVGF